jgi:hypothetical protein
MNDESKCTKLLVSSIGSLLMNDPPLVGPPLTGPSVRRCAIGCRCSPLRVDPEPPPATARLGVVVAVRTWTTAAAAPWRHARVGLYQGDTRRRCVHPSTGTRADERARGSAVARWVAARRKGSECARVWRREASASFVRAENPRDRRIQMSGWRWSVLNWPRWENEISA